MPNPLEKKIFDLLENSLKEGILPEKYYHILLDFYTSYKKATQSAKSYLEPPSSLFFTFIQMILEQFIHPFTFQPYHERIRKPFDYYRFGLELMRPLVDWERSSLEGEESLNEILAYTQLSQNVVFFANHQVEPDPQLMSLLLEKKYPKIAEETIFVAGERVVVDPLAIPISMGRNLLCIYSKKHIDHPPELKLQKQLHNKRTMEKMSELLSEGGKIIFVAPSGGRDRPDEKGDVLVAPFDPSSIEMFYLMAKKAKKPTHFYPLALLTYDILPPPPQLEKEMGEKRFANHSAIHMAVGKEIDMENFPGNDIQDKVLKRKNRSDYIHSLVERDYQKLLTKN